MKELVAVGLSGCAVMLAMHTTPRSSDWDRRLDSGLRVLADSPTALPVRIVVSTRIGTMDAVERRLARAGAIEMRVVATDQLAMQVSNRLLKTVAEDTDVTRLRLAVPVHAAGESGGLLRGTALVGTQALLPHAAPID